MSGSIPVSRWQIHDPFRQWRHRAVLSLAKARHRAGLRGPRRL